MNKFKTSNPQKATAALLLWLLSFGFCATSATGTVGKATRIADALGSGMKAATTPVVVTAGSHSSSSEQHTASSIARVSTIHAGGKLDIKATAGSIQSEGTQISSEGDANLSATEHINLDVAHNTEVQTSDSKASGWGFDNRMTGLPVGVYKNKANGDGATDTVVGTSLSVGGKASLTTTKGDINIIGSNAVSTGDMTLNAGNNLNIVSAQNTAANENHSNNKAIGKVVISDTERFTGYHSEKANNDNQTVTQVSSNVGSLNGNVNATAGNKYTQTASNVVAKNDISVTAKSIDILTAQNTGDSHSDQSATKVGAFARVSSPLIDLVNNIEASSNSDGRLAAMQGMAAAGNAYQAGSAIADMAGAGYGSGSIAKVEVGVGVSNNKSSDNTTYSTSVGNTLKAGNNVKLTTTAGDIHVQQTDLTAGKGIALDSAQDILLEAGQSTSHTDGKHSNYGAEVGVGVSVGAQTGVYAYASANAGKGSYSTDTVTNNNTHLKADNITLTSKGDTTLKGATANANSISTDVGGKLTVQSLQDTSVQTSSETGVNARAQVSFGTAWEASGGVTASKGNGDYAQVTEQSGLFAGNGGYHVKAKEVDLIGGAISSTNAGKSELTADKLTHTDIQNHNTFSSSSSGINLSSTTVAANAIGNLGNVASMTGSIKPTTETASTLATLSEGKLTIGGKATTAAELHNQTGINTDASKANGTVSDAVDIKALLAEQKAMNAAVQTVASSAGQLVTDQQKFAQANAQSAAEALDKAKANGDPALIEQAQTQFDSSVATLKHWGAGGTYNVAVNALAQIVTGIGGDKSPQAIAAVIASPLVANQIGDNISQDNVAGKLVAHALLAGVTAALSGADTKEALSVGLSTGLIESVVTPKLAQELYGTSDPSQLTPEQQQNLLALSGAAGGLLAGIAGDSTNSAVLGAGTALNAVENNYLTRHQNNEFVRKLSAICSKLSGGCSEEEKQKLIAEYTKYSIDNDIAMVKACDANPNGEACASHVRQALDYSSFAGIYLSNDKSRSNANVLNTVFNEMSKDSFIKIVNNIDARADLFSAMANQSPNSRWFKGAEDVSRACFVGLGADGCGSWASFYIGRLGSAEKFYQWRDEAGKAIMQSGYEYFKNSFNNSGSYSVADDIAQLKREQQMLQAIHEKYFKGSNVFDRGDVLRYGGMLYPGVDILDYNSRMEYGCKKMGLTPAQGCKP